MNTFKENYGIYEKFKPLYDEGLNDSEIGKQLGCHNATVTMWRKREGLPSNFSQGHIKDDILDLYNQGLSKKEIVNKEISSYKYTMDLLKDLPDQNTHDVVSDRQKSLIIGTLLGDAWINNQLVFAFDHKYKYRNYTIYKAKNIGLSHKITDREQMRKGTLCKSTGAYFHRHPYLKSLRDIFYPNDKKVFPKEYIEQYFTWESMTYWYLDDGNLSSSYTLAICNFSNQAEIIRKFLFDKLGLEVNIQRKGQILYIPASQRDYFTKNIKPYVPNCMRYKLKNL